MDGSGRSEELGGGKMSEIDNKVTVSAFCRRRLGVMVCRMKMAETVKMVRLIYFVFFPFFKREREFASI